MRLDELTGRRVALLGLGADVAAAVPALLTARPAELVLVDDGLEGEVTVGGHTIPIVSLPSACATAEVMVRSPGFPRYLPELITARDRGTQMTTPIDLFLSSLDTEVRTVLVTGTKGKSTTTDLIGRFATQVGIEVGVAGNLGIPVFDPGWARDAPVVVLEVSSYQASDLHHVPDMAVITSIAEDHLSWHGGLDQYLEDKLRVVGNGGRLADTVLVPHAETRAREVLRQRFPQLAPVLVEEIDSEATVPIHRLRNAALAARVVTELGGRELPIDRIVDGASISLPGRLDPCGPVSSTRGIAFVDDALASNPSATAAGLAWARKNSRDVVLILGGHARGVSDRPLREEAERWNSDPSRRLRCIALPESGEEMARSCGIELLAHADDVATAVGIAARSLDAPTGEPMVLFSPAAPTPADVGNWETRSARFREAVAQLE